MKALLAILALLVMPVSAQPVPFTLPSCTPEGLGGTGKGYLVRETAAGVCRGYWCQKSDGTWSGWKHCVLARYASRTVNAAANAAPAASSPLEALHAFVTATQRVPAAADVPAYNALHADMSTAMQATRPDNVVLWRVDSPTSADGTRPAYPFANGTRGTTSTARATSGQPCKPEVAQVLTTTSGTVWAAYGPAFSPNMVALCRRQ